VSTTRADGTTWVRRKRRTLQHGGRSWSARVARRRNAAAWPVRSAATMAQRRDRGRASIGETHRVERRRRGELHAANAGAWGPPFSWCQEIRQEMSRIVGGGPANPLIRSKFLFAEELLFPRRNRAHFSPPSPGRAALFCSTILDAFRGTETHRNSRACAAGARGAREKQPASTGTFDAENEGTPNAESRRTSRLPEAAAEPESEW
jgi:hypothetical protein